MPIVQQRRGTAASLQSVTLAAGQIAYETDTGKVKVGDGTTVYSSLEYITDASNIADGSINTNHLAANAVTTDKVTDLNVTAAKLADDAVTTRTIADNAITNAHLQDNSVNTAEIVDDAVTTSKIPDNAVTGAKFATDSIITEKLANEAVSTAKLANDAVTTAKIADDAVTSSKIAANAVTNTEIAANTILTGNIAGQAVNTQSITDDAVTYAKIQNVSNGNRLLGREASSAGLIQEIEVTPYVLSLFQESTSSQFLAAINGVAQSDIDTAIANLIDSAPGALDTLNELAAALGDDANFSTTITNSLATTNNNVSINASNITSNQASLSLKMPLAGGTFTGDVTIGQGSTGGAVDIILPRQDTTTKHQIKFLHNGVAGFSNPANELDFIRLYSDGSNWAGMGISSGHMNIGTKGSISMDIYTDGSIRTEYDHAGEVTHYTDHNFGTNVNIGGRLEVPRGNNPGTPVIVSEYNGSVDTNSGIYFPAGDEVAISIAGSEQVHVTGTALQVNSGAIHAPTYRVDGSSNVAGSTTSVAIGQAGDSNTGIYFPAANQIAVTANGDNRVNFNANSSLFYRNASQPTIKADTGNSGYMIIDSAGSYLSLNHYVGDDILLCYATGGSGDVIIGASTTTNPNPDNRKLLVEGDTETKGITYSDRYITDTIGSAQDPAFEIVNPNGVDGTGWYTPSTMVNGGNSSGYGFAIAAAHNHVAEFGYKSHIGNGRPTIYNGGAAALLELNGNSRRGSLFGYNIYNTSSSMANEAIGGEFLCIAQGGTSANNVKGFKSKLQSQSTNGLRANAGHFELSMESVTGSWGNAYGVHCELNIASSCTGSFTGSSAALYVDAVGKTSNATYPSTDGIDNVYAIFQDGNTDNNRFDGTSWFRNNVHIVNGGDLNISSGQIKLPNGSGTDPAICFDADTDTGIKRNTNGNFDIVTAGTNRLSITTSGDIHTSSGGTVYLNNHVTIGNTLTVTNGINVSELAQSSATTGQYLKWDGSAWVPSTISSGGGSSTFAGLTDTSVSTVSAGQMLWYNGSAFANIDVSTILGLYGTVSGLSDTAVNSPAENQLLRYNSSTSKWQNYHPDTFTSGSGVVSGTHTINLANANKIHKWTPASSGVQTLSLSNIPSQSGVACSFTLVIVYPGSGTTTAIIQWPSSFKWAGGTAPTLTNTGGKTDTFTFLSLDNGTTWLGHVGGQNF